MNGSLGVRTRIADYLEGQGALGQLRLRAAYEKDIDDLIAVVVPLFASSADPDVIRDQVLDDWVQAMPRGGARAYAMAVASAAKSDTYAASPVARVVGARVAARFAIVSLRDVPRYVREIAWRVDDFPVELVFGDYASGESPGQDPPRQLDTWRGWLHEFWEANGDGEYFERDEVREILSLRPGQEHRLRATAFHYSVLRRVNAAAAGVDITEDLAFINRVRVQTGLRPLDPAAAGWSDEDVRLEAARLRREGNPRSSLLAWR